MSTIRAGIVRFGVAAAISLGLVATFGAPAMAADSGAPTVAAQEEPSATNELSATQGLCPRGTKLGLVESYGAPVGGAQATFTVAADEGPGSVVVEVRYEDSKGRTKYYNLALPRPVAASVALPFDGRGVSNVVKVYARVVASDFAGVMCGVTVNHNGALPPLDQQCYANIGINDPTLQNNPPIAFEYGSPRAAVQPRVVFETRAVASDISFDVWMTNSAGSRRKVADALFSPWQVHPLQTILLPRDGRGVYNVVKAEIKMNGAAWYDVLRCSPSVDAGGGLSAIESQCFAGNDVKFAVDSASPVEATVALETRASRADIAVMADAFHSNGTRTGMHRYVEVPDADGLPWTAYSLPGDGSGIADVDRLHLRVDMVDWPALLTCSPGVGSMQNPEPTAIPAA